MAPAKKLYLESIHARDELPPVTRPPVDRVVLARYAGASGDYNPMHVDEAAARAAGYPSVHAPGMLVMGQLGQLVTDWARSGKVIRLGSRFIKLVWPGDVITAKGLVRERRGEGGRYFAELDLSCENQKGERVLRGWATVQFFYSAEDEARQRRGEPPLVAEVKDEPPEEKGKKPKAPPPKPRPQARPGAKPGSKPASAAARSSKPAKAGRNPSHGAKKAKPAGKKKK